jgi:hypothetical protein
MTDVHGKPRRRCPSCGFIHWRNPGVGAAVVVFDDDGRLLMVRLQEAQRGALSVESVPGATQRLARLAEARLADPTVELMAEVFDLLEVDLIRIEGRTFEGVARLPLPDPDADSEVWKGVPQDPLSNLPWSEMRIPFPISVELPVKWVAE